MSVKARFICRNVEKTGNDDFIVRFDAHTGPGSEDFAKYTPWGQITMGLNKDAKAASLFEANKVYTLTFEETK